MRPESVLFEQMLGGAVSAEALHWLGQAFQQFDRCDGELSLERCLKLPSHQQRARERRDYWLRDAASRMHLPPGSVALHRALAQAFNDFTSRGAWAWARGAAHHEPPIELTPFDCALWHAAKAMKVQGRDAGLSPKQIGRIVDMESA